MTPAIEFRDVRKRYGRTQALDGLSFQVSSGSICGLVGSNGAGKTTTMAIAGGALLRYQGDISILGERGFDVERLMGRLTMIPQDSELPRYARVRNVLSYYARLQGLTVRECRESVADVLDWTHLADRAGATVRSLSHGMKRRVAVAQAFLGSPELVLLDEPMNGLDPVEKARIRDLLKSRAGKQTIIISSHNLDEIERVCDQVLFLEKGRLAAEHSLASLESGCEVRYQLRRAPENLNVIEALVSGLSCRVLDEGWLVCRLNSEMDVSDLNQIILGWLLQQNAGVIRVESGRSLERHYLEQIHGESESG